MKLARDDYCSRFIAWGSLRTGKDPGNLEWKPRPFLSKEIETLRKSCARSYS